LYKRTLFASSEDSAAGRAPRRYRSRFENNKELGRRFWKRPSNTYDHTKAGAALCASATGDREPGFLPVFFRSWVSGQHGPIAKKGVGNINFGEHASGELVAFVVWT
jgi:hypothetical protein